ncbi:MAG: substrate-binding domain-containing protein [Phycisphaeraceae bacterium]|nr:substrate-binding domain-containing protein [Phycisphaeraceae bacterium]
MSLPRRRIVLGIAALLASVALTGASPESVALASSDDGLVVYLAADERLARPVIEAFERRAGVKVRVVAHDPTSVEPLAARVKAAKADAIWSSEPLRAIALAHEGVLARHDTATARARDAQWIGRESRWHGFAASLGGFAINSADVLEAPKDEFSEGRWQFRHASSPVFSYGMFVIGRPETSDSIAHLAMVHSLWGTPHFQTWCFQSRRQEMRVLPDDAEVARAVARREAGAGLLDSANAAMHASEGSPMRFVAVDHEIPVPGTMEVQHSGLMVIPQVVGVVESGANRATGARFVDFVLSPDAERLLIAGERGLAPLHRDLATEFKAKVPGLVSTVNLDGAAEMVPETLRIFRRAFPE